MEKENVQKLLSELNFDEYGYPYCDVGYLFFLRDLGFKLDVYNGEGESFGEWSYLIEDNRSNFFSEDDWSDESYDTFEEAFNNGLINCLKSALESPEI